MLDGKRIRRRLQAPPGKCFTPDGVEQALGSAAAQLERDYPKRAFRLAPLRGSAFNFVEVKALERIPDEIVIDVTDHNMTKAASV